MSYHIYTTEGLILKRANFGEANILLSVLTRELGLIMASAQSARLSVSKLRGHLSDYSLVTLSCVKGKGGWRITSVSIADNFYFNYPTYIHATLANVSQLLLKMITGESPHAEVFDTVLSGFSFLSTLEEKDVQNFETILVLRILFELGYVAKAPETEGFLSAATIWNSEILENAAKNRLLLVGLINKALKESQM